MSGTPQLEELRELVQRVLGKKLDAHAELQHVASLLLNNADLLRSLSKEDREAVLVSLFPYFELPPGWLIIARRGEIRGEWLALVMVRRVTEIQTEAQARAEVPLIRRLLEPSRRRDAMYGHVLGPYGVKQIIKVVERFAQIFQPEGKTLLWLKVAYTNNQRRPHTP